LGAKKFLSDNSYGPAGHGFNEFQEKYQTVQELKKQDAELTADLQKVNAQLELSKSMSYVAKRQLLEDHCRQSLQCRTELGLGS
jgi:uncharacterized protein YeaO (DUF488 family)